MKWILQALILTCLIGCAAPPVAIETSNVGVSGAVLAVALAMTPLQKNRNHLIDKNQRQKCEKARLELAVATENKKEELISQYQRDVEILCVIKEINNENN